MLKEITITGYERYAKGLNKNGLMRSYNTICEHSNEFFNVSPLGVTNKFILECTIDKGNVEDVIELFKSKGFKNLGDSNYYFLENMTKDYTTYEKFYNQNAEAMAAIKKDVANMKKEAKPYKEIENDDCVFYVEGNNSKTPTLAKFIKKMKKPLLEYAKENDVTIMLKVLACNDSVDGFFGFNFLDADEKEKEVVIEYASSINIKVNVKNKYSVFVTSALLTGIGDSEKEIIETMNVSLLADNAK